MKITQKAFVLVIIGLLGMSGSALAAGQTGPFYFGAKIGNASYDYDNVDNSTTTQFYIGYRQPKSLFGLEVSYIDLGKAEVTGSTLSLNVSGFNISGVYHSPATSGKMGFFLNAGIYSFDNDIKVGSTTVQTASGSGLSLGAGLDYALTDSFYFRAGLEMYVGVKDTDSDKTVTQGNIGLEYHF